VNAAAAPGGRAVLLAGATGLVGRETLALFLAEPGVARVTALVRRPLAPPPTSPRFAEAVVDFDRLDATLPADSADVAVCCLGTTIKVAGSRERFRAVDFGLPLAFARAALARGARRFLLVSALGASATSRVFYNRVKGELEDALAALPFDGLGIVRPSLLLGDRAEFRLGEALARPFARLVPGRYRPVHARAVAAALVRLAREDAPGRRIVESEAIRRWAREGR
jgi:uncharacterized protein YbjT (DUF2867 family)